MKLYNAILASTIIASVISSCQNVEPESAMQQGQVILSCSDIAAYIDGGTRAATLTDLDGYTFTLDGTDSEGKSVSYQIAFQKDGDTYSSIIPAGQYTITADNTQAAQSGLGCPYYQGTSAEFTLTPGGSVSVSISMGKPRNSQITLSQDPSFTALYDLIGVEIHDETSRNITLNAQTTTGYVMVPSSKQITYTIKAQAKQGSHVSDLPTSGLSKTITIQSGHSYTISLTAQSISDMMIGIGDGEHGGEFDARPMN